jgi:hypothetical protein
MAWASRSPSGCGAASTRRRIRMGSGDVAGVRGGGVTTRVRAATPRSVTRDIGDTTRSDMRDPTRSRLRLRPGWSSSRDARRSRWRSADDPRHRSLGSETAPEPGASGAVHARTLETRSRFISTETCEGARFSLAWLRHGACSVVFRRQVSARACVPLSQRGTTRARCAFPHPRVSETGSASSSTSVLTPRSTTNSSRWYPPRRVRPSWRSVSGESQANPGRRSSSQASSKVRGRYHDAKHGLPVQG